MLQHVETLSPEECLWLAILKGDDDFMSMEDDDVRASLLEGHFPERLIERFLAERPRAT